MSRSHPDYRKQVLFDDIDRLSELKEDWDSYGGLPITQASMDAAKSFVSKFQAVPTTGGGVVFEVRYGKFEISMEFTAEGEVEGAWLSWERLND